jgi:hypothetical protein
MCAFATSSFLATSAAAVDFAHEIVPLVRKACGECHTGESKKGGFSMNDREQLVNGGESGSAIDLDNPRESELLRRVTSNDYSDRMPPEGPSLTKAEVELLRRWITEGTEWEPGFKFESDSYEPPLKPRKVQLPTNHDGHKHPVDRIVAQYFHDRNIPWPQRVPDEQFLRRVSMDLIGLLPTIEERACFLADERHDKRERLVDELLARPTDYAEHWLTFWNDLLRNDYGGTGFITGGRSQISNWLYQALETNLPFDKMTRDLIAPSTPESRGFIDGIKWRGNVSAGQTVEIQFAQSVGQAFMGINLKCASCHDSFIDRWKLQDAYRLAAIYSEQSLEIHRCDKAVGEFATPGWLFPELGEIDPNATRDERLRQLAQLMTHRENGRVTRTIVNRLWHRLFGRGIVHPLDAMQTPPWCDDLLDYVAEDFRENGYDLKHTLRLLATSEIYASHAEVRNSGAVASQLFTFAGPQPKRLTAEQFVDALWQLTGVAPRQYDAPVIRGGLNMDETDLPELTAQWIWGDSAADGKTLEAGEEILLTTSVKLDSEVITGVAVVTCENEYSLYVNGRLVLNGDGWQRVGSVTLHDKFKSGNNQIAVIAKNQGSQSNPVGLLFQAAWIPIEGEVATLASGDAWKWGVAANNRKEGRLGALPNDLSSVMIVPALPAWSAAVKQPFRMALARGTSGAELMVRASLLKSDFLMRSLGRPNRDQIVSMRPEELTTLEAIDLANGTVIADAISQSAETLSTSDPATKKLHAIDFFVRALTREPTETERRLLEEFVIESTDSSGLEDALWSILMLPEFQTIR